MKSRRYALAIAIAVLVVAVLVPIAGANWRSRGTIVGQAANLGGKAGITVASVNGVPISLRAVEATRASLQVSGSPEGGSREAYTKALTHQLRETVLSQEALRRGLSVGDEEARSYLSRLRVQAEQSVEARQFLADQGKALGVSGKDYDALLLQTVKQGLLNGKLLEQLGREAPVPTEAQINVYLARQPGPNALILIPLHLNKSQKPGQVYKELQHLRVSEKPQHFMTTFDEYVRKLGARKPTEFVHQTFRFTAVEELPVYARDAAGRPEGSLVLTSHRDGAATVSLVLKSSSTSAKEARASARQLLSEEQRAGYIEEVTDRLMDGATIRLYTDRLPPEARALTVESLR